MFPLTAIRSFAKKPRSRLRLCGPQQLTQQMVQLLTIWLPSRRGGGEGPHQEQGWQKQAPSQASCWSWGQESKIADCMFGYVTPFSFHFFFLFWIYLIHHFSLTFHWRLLLLFCLFFCFNFWCNGIWWVLKVKSCLIFCFFVWNCRYFWWFLQKTGRINQRWQIIP